MVPDVGQVAERDVPKSAFSTTPMSSVVLSGSFKNETMASPMVQRVDSRYLKATSPMQVHLMAPMIHIATEIVKSFRFRKAD